MVFLRLGVGGPVSHRHALKGKTHDPLLKGDLLVHVHGDNEFPGSP